MHRYFSSESGIRRNSLGVIGAILSTLILVLGTNSYCHAEKFSTNSQDLSLTIRHQPTEKVIRQLSRLSGYKIEIDQGYDNMPISLEIQSVDLNRALIEVLRSLRVANHAILMDEDNKTAAIIIFPSSDDAYSSLASNHSSGKARNGTGAVHVEQIKQDYYNRTVSPHDIVSPPSDDGRRPGITRHELETIKENYRNRKKQMPKDTVVIPSSIDGEPGTTLAEVERIKREYQSSSSLRK